MITIPFSNRFCTLWAASTSLLNVVPVFPKQDIGIFPADTLGGWNIVVFCLQPPDDLFRGLIVRLSAFGVDLSDYLIQAKYSDLRIIGKFQQAPANCRLRDGSNPILSSLLFILRNIL